jgi:polysaccharide biosynthesis protein PslG
MLSRFRRILLLPKRILLIPKFGLLAIGVALVGACAAGVPLIATAASPGSVAEARGGAGVLGSPEAAATPAVASLPASATPSKSASTTKKKTPSAKTGSAGSGTVANGPTVFGYAAPELLAWSQSEQIQQLEAMKATGVTSVRLDASWWWGQPNGPGSYDWGPLDQVMGAIQQVGMTADLIIDGCPAWAAVSGQAGNQNASPASPAAYATWAAAVAQRYGGMGATYFEIWNEPNNPQFWAPAPDPAAYTALLKAAYPAIKAVDPSAIVLSAGLSPAVNDGDSISPITFLQDMYADGAQGNFDGLGFHPYSYPVDPNVDNPQSAWSQMDQTDPSIRSIMEANGDGSKKIYITEFGAPTDDPSAANVSESDQAAELSEAISEVKTYPWVGAFYIFTWEDGNGTGFGVLNADGSQKPSYSAVVSALQG